MTDNIDNDTNLFFNDVLKLLSRQKFLQLESLPDIYRPGHDLYFTSHTEERLACRRAYSARRGMSHLPRYEASPARNTCA